jgi:hypothetical protein
MVVCAFMVVRVMRHKPQGKQYTKPPPDLMQMGGRTRGQKDEGASPKGGVWKGVGKTPHQDTYRRAVVVCLSLSVYSGRGGVDSRRSTGRGDGDEVLSFLLNTN